MITKEELSEIMEKLNELLDIEVPELQEYSETSVCVKAKQGMENEYEYHKKKVRLISEIKNIIFCSDVFH